MKGMHSYSLFGVIRNPDGTLPYMEAIIYERSGDVATIRREVEYQANLNFANDLKYCGFILVFDGQDFMLPASLKTPIE